MAFVKLDCGILMSTLWLLDEATCKVFITMLAMADCEGFVRATCPGIAGQAHMPKDRVSAALTILEAPDPESRTKDLDGARILKTPEGYQITNYLKYRAYDHTAPERMRRYRAKKKEATVTANAVTSSASASSSVSVPLREGSEEGRVLPPTGTAEYLAKEFSHCQSPGIASKTRAIAELIRTGTDPKEIASSARRQDRKAWGFWDHMRLMECRHDDTAEDITASPRYRQMVADHLAEKNLPSDEAHIDLFIEEMKENERKSRAKA